jgi:hypothetical protein
MVDSHMSRMGECGQLEEQEEWRRRSMNKRFCTVMVSHIPVTRLLAPIPFPRENPIPDSRKIHDRILARSQDRIFPSADVSVVRLVPVDYSATRVASTQSHLNYFTTRAILNPSLKLTGVRNADG